MGESDAVDLALRLMAGGTPLLRAEQVWAARLMYAGLLDGQDAELYRRKYVLELLCAAHDGPSVADPGAVDLGLLLLGTAARAAAIPSLAKHLGLSTGEHH